MALIGVRRALIRRKTVVVASSYQGPGDVVSGAGVWGSPARAYSAAFAAGLTAVMDLQDQAGANPITINILSTGFVNVAAISAWVTANSVSTIKVAKIYDQTGNGNHLTQAVLATMPTLTMSAVNSLPGLTGAGAATLAQATNFTATQPNFTLTGVFKRTGAFTSAATVAGFSAVGISVGNGAVADQAIATAGTNLTVAGIVDNAFHAFSFVPNGASSVVNIDNAETTAAGGAGAPTANAMRVLSANGSGFHTGIVMEFGFWGTVGFSGTQRTNMNSNMHGANGYNF